VNYPLKTVAQHPAHLPVSMSCLICRKYRYLHRWKRTWQIIYMSHWTKKKKKDSIVNGLKYKKYIFLKIDD